MRYNDFKKQIQEDDDLLEIRMDPTSLAAATKNIDATVGIEFEMIVPGGEDDDPELEQDYSYDEDTRNIENIVYFFNDNDYNTGRAAQRLETALRDDFSSWAGDSFDDRWRADGEEFVYRYIRDNVDAEDLAKLLDLDPEKIDGFTKSQMAEAAGIIFGDQLDPWYTNAFDSAQQDYFDDEDLPSEWLDSVGLETMQDVERQYDITWPHWEPVQSNNEGASIDDIARSFSQYIGKPVNASQSYHGGRREAGHYVVEPDGSINAPDGYIGLEFVSPPMPLSEMIAEIEKVREWAESVGAETNKSTGLHMNVSVPGLNNKTLDYVKLALLLGDQYVLQQFGRQANTYTVGAFSKIKDQIKKLSAEQLENYLDQVKGKLNRRASELLGISGFGKYTSINPKTGYIEFRSPGGDYLNEDLDKLVNTLRRFVVATQAAMDPDAYRQEYVSKLTKLLSPPNKSDNDTVQYFARYAAGELPKQALKSFLRQAQLQRKVGKNGPIGKMWWQVGLKSNPSYSIEVVGTTRAEAIQAAIDNTESWQRFNFDSEDFFAKPIRPYDSSPVRATVGEPQAVGNRPVTTPPPILNGRPSNPDGNAYIAALNDVDTPVYRFMAVNGDDARTVLDQWDRAYGGNWAWRPDPRQERGQPAIPGSTIDLARRRAAAAQSQPRTLTAPESNPDANYAIVRNSDDAVIDYFTRNTQGEAERSFRIWLDQQNADESLYTLVSVTPRQSTQSSGNNRLWQIVDSADGEVAYEFYLSSENNQQDANEVGMRWVRNNGDPNTTYSVRERTEQTGTLQTQNQQWRILIDGEEVHRFYNRNNQGEANTAARAWVLQQIRLATLNPAPGAEIEVVPVTADTPAPPPSPSGPRIAPGRDYFENDQNGRFEIVTSGAGSSPNNYKFNLPRDVMRGAGYLESANLNAVRYLRDRGVEEDEFNQYEILDRAMNTRHEIY